MQYNPKLDAWCRRAWIKLSCGITAGIFLAVLVSWNRWNADIKLMLGIAALIPIHVIEEWVFPGGFHYQYNCLFKSDIPDRYPMCRLSDMITNLGATVFFFVIGIIGIAGHSIPDGIILGSMVFCILEVVVHTILGTMMHLKFRSEGKTTIYGPGSITAYLGFGFFGAMLCYSLEGRDISAGDWLACAGFVAAILILFILLPENILKRRDNDYNFESAGYFDRFLK